MRKKIWTCKIGEVDNALVPSGGDAPMRKAVYDAYLKLTGKEPDFNFSGWAGSLDDVEREVVVEQKKNLAKQA